MADLSLEDIFGGTGSMTNQIIQNQKDIAEMKPIVNIAYTPNNKPTPAALGALNKAGDTMTGDLTIGANLVMNTRYIKGANGSTFFRDHGNGHTTISGGLDSSGNAGDLFIGYNSQSVAANTRNVRLESPMTWRSGHTCINSNGELNSDKMYGDRARVFRTRNGDKSSSTQDQVDTLIGDETNRGGMVLIAGGESMAKLKAFHALGSYEGVVLAGDGGDGAIFYSGLQTATGAMTEADVGKATVSVGSYRVYGQRKNNADWSKFGTFNRGSADVFIHNNSSNKYLQLRDDGFLAYSGDRVYHAGYKPTPTDVGAIPANTKFYSNAPLLTKTADYGGDSSLRNLDYAGFYRLNGMQLDSKALPSLMIHCPHSSGKAHARGIGFGYGTTWKTTTYRFDSSGVYQGESKIYHEQDKPTAAELGVVNKAGDTMTGNLTAPEFHANEVFNNGWFRAKGQNGLYFQDYGGGFHMTDGVWVRVYNNRKFHVPNGEGDCINAGGGIYAGGNGNFNDVYIRSDKRLKSNIKLTSHNLDKILKLKPVMYDKKRTLDSTETEQEIGLIAQDVESIESLAVGTGVDELKALKPYALISMLVGAVQEQQKQINKLTKLIEMRK